MIIDIYGDIAFNVNNKMKSLGVLSEMIKIIVTALITFIATSVDEIPILFLLYSKSGNKGKAKIISACYFIGSLILMIIGILGAYGLGVMPIKWIAGLTGLIPFAMGLNILIRGEHEDEEQAKMLSMVKKFGALVTQVLAITIGLGVDDLGVYLPLFTMVNGSEILLMVTILLLGTAILCYISFKLTQINKLTIFINQYERYIVGVVLMIIGIIVLYENFISS